ncbi:MAG TPA: hemolysin III family protein [Syntrophales bacterium]|nr:hemolysin III family protein [Syntrophales bacterium]
MTEVRVQTRLEEITNSAIHGVGLVLSIAALAILVVPAAFHGETLRIISGAIYGITLVLLYAASTLYHAFKSPRLKHVFKIIDHSCIYLLIAGTYTPFTLITLQGILGRALFGIVWTLAFLGILFQIYFVYRFKILATLAYIIMGWLVVIAIKPLIQLLPAGGMLWLFAGGVAYTGGAVFYLWKSLPFHHAIWHFFVLSGGVCHFIAVMFYVIPVKTS